MAAGNSAFLAFRRLQAILNSSRMQINEGTKLKEANRGGFSRRLVKPACFLLVISLLLFFSEFTVAYTSFPTDAIALPQGARDKITIVAIAGMMQVSYNQQMGEDAANVQSPINVASWNMTDNQVFMQPLTTLSIGCENSYRSLLGVRVDTDNQLGSEERGMVNISVFDQTGKQLYDSKLLNMDFVPGSRASASANFSIVTLDANPVFLVRVSFPTDQDLTTASSALTHVTLFQYVLMKLGLTFH